MKYIDAEKLKEDIQANLAAISFNDDYQEGYEACGMSVLKSIDALPNESASEDLEKEIQEEFPEEWMKLDDKVKTFIIHKIFNWGVERQKIKDNALKEKVSFYLREIHDCLYYMHSGNIAHNRPPALADVRTLGKLLYEEGLFDVENKYVREEFGLPEKL